MLKQHFKDRCRDYQHCFNAYLGNHGPCDVFRFEVAQDSYALWNTEVYWLIMSETNIIAFGGIPECLRLEVALVRNIFDAIKDGCHAITDIVTQVRKDNPEHIFTQPLITARVLKLLSDGSLVSGPNSSVQIPCEKIFESETKSQETVNELPPLKADAQISISAFTQMLMGNPAVAIPAYENNVIIPEEVKTELLFVAKKFSPINSKDNVTKAIEYLLKSSNRHVNLAAKILRRSAENYNLLNS